MSSSETLIGIIKNDSNLIGMFVFLINYKFKKSLKNIQFVR